MNFLLSLSEQEIRALIIFCLIVFIFLVIFIQSCAEHFKRVYKEAKAKKHREILLEKAKPYLDSYDFLWKYQTLRARSLVVELKSLVINIKDESRTLKISGKKQEIDIVWDYILEHFSEHSTYDDLCLSIQTLYERRFRSMEFCESVRKVP